MCGCNKTRPAEATWQVSYPDNTTKDFSSSVQARVAAARVPGAVAKPKAG
jgi:hypothetical protein